MTTILMRENKKTGDVEIGYDSLCTGGTKFELETEKVFVNKSNGIIFGVAGLLLLNQELRYGVFPSVPKDPALTENWLAAVLVPHLRRLFNEIAPRRGEDYMEMQVLAVIHGKVYEIGCDLAISRKNNGGVYAIGSGGKLALGALRVGAEMEQALEVAAENDSYTGGRLTVTTAKKLLATA